MKIFNLISIFTFGLLLVFPATADENLNSANLIGKWKLTSLVIRTQIYKDFPDENITYYKNNTYSYDRHGEHIVGTYLFKKIKDSFVISRSEDTNKNNINIYEKRGSFIMEEKNVRFSSGGRPVVSISIYKKIE